MGHGERGSKWVIRHLPCEFFEKYSSLSACMQWKYAPNQFLDDCSDSPCVNGECVDGVNSYECKCTLGYNGKNCEESKYT